MGLRRSEPRERFLGGGGVSGVQGGKLFRISWHLGIGALDMAVL